MGKYRYRILKTSFLVLSILTTVMVNGALGQSYCPASGTNTSYEWIESVAIGTTLNGFGSQGGYADFTDQTIDLATGEHDVTLTPGFRYGSYTEYWMIWLDLNQDGTFEGSELLYSGSASGTINGQILVPEDALGGDTRMRVSMKYGALPLACGPFTYGEVEDYTVHIQADEGTDPGPGGEPEYCGSNGNITSYEWIGGVAIGSFSHNSGENDGYGDFTDQVATLGQGANELTLIPGFGYSSYDEYWQVWIDLDQDGVFSDEEVLFSGNSQGTLSGEIVVPPDTPEGNTRMRISMKWGGQPPSCGSFTYGEVEDYTVRVETEAAQALGEISSMAAGIDPEVVYAIDRDNQALYFISTSAQQIVETVTLPDSQPVAMAYSNPGNDLYIVSATSGAITVFDLDTSQTSQIVYSDTKTGHDIAVAPTLRRIFVLSPNGYDAYLTIVDMDTGAVLLEDKVGGSSIALDENSRMIFIGNSGLSPSTMRKYYVGNDELQLVQSIQAGSNGRSVNISPDGLHVVYPCGSGNGAGYTIHDFDSTDLNNVFGEWDVGTYPKNAVFSPDGSVLFGTNGSAYDNYLYVMDAATYQQIMKIDFPNADDYAVFAPNSDGTVVVGFSYDSYNDDDYALYFFTDVLPDPPAPLPELGKISDMAAGSDPEFVYAIDEDNQSLYFISTSFQSIVNTISLPDPQPKAMDYSLVDNKLYIVSEFSGQITVFDLNNSQISQLPFSATQDGSDIAVAPLLRRIFVLSPNGYDAYLTIVDMDTGTVLLEDAVGGSSIALDENSRMIFTGNSGLSPSTMRKYYVGNDELQLVQSIQAGSNGRSVNISPDGLHVVYPCGSGNGAGYTIHDFDSTDLNNVFGEWDVGTYPKNAVFSPDGSVLFGTNGSAYDNYLYVMDAATYQQITKIDFPNADDYAVFGPNSDGTVVVGFSYDSYNDDDYALYFFTDTLF